MEAAYNLKEVMNKPERLAPGHRMCAGCGGTVAVRAVLRALHFFEDDRRAAKEAAALKNGDFEFFLVLVEQSGLSSALHLQNTWSIHDPAQQAVPLALAEAERLLDKGAVRVHGGGFAGTIQAWVPNEELSGFKAGMEALLGEGSCHVLRIRPVGGVRLA